MLRAKASPAPLASGERPKTVLAQVMIFALIVAAWVLGGGGGTWPVSEAALQCIVALAAVIWMWSPALRRSTPSPGEAALVALLLLIIPALQLVPLPPKLWQALPGREIEWRSLALVHAADDWRPWSIAPGRTFAALLAMLPPALIISFVAALHVRDRWIVPATITLVGMLSLLIGAGQISGGSGNALRFYAPESPWIHGFEVNHNTQADVFLLALLAFAAMAREAIDRAWIPRGRALAAFSGGWLLLAVGVVLTASRTGIVLLPITLGFGLAILWPHLRLGRTAMQSAGACGGVLAMIAIGLILTDNPIGEALARFDFTGEKRPGIWADSLLALAHYWPFGAGAGTFVPAFAPFERVEALYPFPVEHAHNEYIEAGIEAGIPASIVIAGVIAILFRAGWRHFKEPGKSAQASVLFALGACTIIALHSIVDYPLRSMALACMAAASAGLFIGPRRGRRVSPTGSGEVLA